MDAGVEEVFAYLQIAPNADRFLVVLNFGSNEHMLDLSQAAQRATIALATGMVRRGAVEL